MKLISLEKMKELEFSANEKGYSFVEMMQKAGHGLAEIVHKRFFSTSAHQVLGLVGGGNNGADTIIALESLQKLGWIASAYIPKAEELFIPLINSFVDSGGRVVSSTAFIQEINNSHVILDGLIGTGFRPPMRKDLAQELIKVAQNRQGKKIVAVDCPSGVDCVSGEASAETLGADLTVCMEAIKEGLLKLPAFEFCGDFETVELGIPEKVLKTAERNDVVIDQSTVAKSLKERPRDSHKGSFGHLIVCGGCINYAGAPNLAARSAYRVGTGLVEMAIPECIYGVAARGQDESIITILQDQDGVIAEGGASTLSEKIKNATCLLIGPGIGTETQTKRFVKKILFEPSYNTQSHTIGFIPEKAENSEVKIRHIPPLVIDADGLRILAEIPDWYNKIDNSVVLTPHPGEMSSLTGLSVVEIQKDRMGIVKRFSQLWQKVVVLKGALTAVASPDGELAVLPFANSALAKAGTGDVLAGIIAGLRSQGYDPYQAAKMGVWIHAEAARLVVAKQANEFSLIASDLIDALPKVMGLISQNKKQ